MENVEAKFGNPQTSHHCGCGGHGNDTDYPKLSATDLPHEIRHAAIMGALASVQEGRGLVLCADHNPVPLLRQVQGQFPNVFNIEYLEEGPEQWQVQFER